MNRVARYRMLLTKNFCLLLGFYFPARNMRGERVETNCIFCTRKIMETFVTIY